MLSQQIPDTREEAAAKLPALHILTVLGWDYLSPSQCIALRGSERAVVLEDVLRDHLSRHRFDYKGKHYPLSTNGIAQVLREITQTGLSEGLIPANRAIYQHLTMGITVTEFVDGSRASITVPLIDWADIAANRFQVTEEVSASTCAISKATAFKISMPIRNFCCRSQALTVAMPLRERRRNSGRLGGKKRSPKPRCRQLSPHRCQSPTGRPSLPNGLTGPSGILSGFTEALCLSQIKIGC